MNLFGYSFGADVLPFVVNRLTRSSLAKVERVVVAGLDHDASFEFYLSVWVGGSTGDSL